MRILSFLRLCVCVVEMAEMSMCVEWGTDVEKWGNVSRDKLTSYCTGNGVMSHLAN
jgi:hypothetical protein